MYQEWTDGNGNRRKAPIPAHIAAYVQVIGEDETEKLLLNFGGAPAYFALRPEKVNSLAEHISRESIKKLADAFGGRCARVPMGNEFLARHMRSKLIPVNEIARQLRKTDKWVRSALAAEGPKKAAPALPELQKVKRIGRMVGLR